MTERIAIVLAAGQGTRMKSSRPKVLHEVAGRPMIVWSIETALAAGATQVVAVLGHGKDEVESVLRARFGDRVHFAIQAEQRGTGHAVKCGLDAIPDAVGVVLVLYGDCPLVRPAVLESLLAVKGDAPLAMLTMTLADPTGYGRILYHDGRIVGVREQRDCSDEERAERRVNPGMYAIDSVFLRESLGKLRTNNAQGELYLTDVVEMAQGRVAEVPSDHVELLGVNDRVDLAECERQMRARIARMHMKNGVTIRDPSSTTIEAEVVIDEDVVLEPHVVLRGKTKIGRGARIDVGCVISDVEIAPFAILKPYSVASESKIGERAQVGPFSHIRPASELGPEVHIGNFVETKKTSLGRGSKANHLAYLGDGKIGEGVNVGAGTIFCNYDGFKKHVTTLDDGCFIGSDSQLVAPVRVGKGAYVGTGTTVTKDVPDNALAISRVKQDNKEGYASRLRAKLKGG